MNINDIFNKNLNMSTSRHTNAMNADPLQYNVNKNHPLIPNANQYFYYKKYVSINSEDRDVLKYPLSSLFEIEMPEDLNNVLGVSLAQWSFPANYDTFSEINGNLTMTFKFTSLYNPGEFAVSNPLQEAIFEALYANIETTYVVIISEGFYTPEMIVVELTNRFNATVTTVIKNYFIEKSYTDLLLELEAMGGYSQFIIVYNSVQQKIWFGNRSCGFVLTNDSPEIFEMLLKNGNCINRSQLPDFSNWGLPSYIGLTKTPIPSIQTDEVPRFYYGDVTPGDNGYWLLPDPALPGSKVSYIKSPYKINIMGPSYIFMEIDGLNSIDETSPYNVSKFTTQTNETNGRVNAAFAKIPLTTTPLSQYFDENNGPHKYFMPPADKIRRLKIRLRYHNGQLVDFSTFDYSFMLEFVLFVPQIDRKYTVFNPIFI
jgi:hypothetical protein